MSEYTEKAGYSIALQVDSDIASKVTEFTNTAVGTYATDITDAVIATGLQTIDEADAPIEDRYFVIHPAQKAKLLQLDKFVTESNVGLPNVRVEKGPNSRYLWGTIYGMQVFYTNNVRKVTTETQNMLFHREAIALALQQKPRTQCSYEHPYLGYLVSVDVIYGLTLLRGTFGVNVKS